MKCPLCNDGMIEREGQVEACENCGGSGEIVTQEEVYGNDCPNGSCDV